MAVVEGADRGLSGMIQPSREWRFGLRATFSSIIAVTLLKSQSASGSNSTLELVSPVEASRCSFTPGGGKDYVVRTHPLLGTRHQHTGVDLSAAEGTPYMAPGDGVITAIRSQNSSDRCGQIIEIQHSENLFSHSCHMLEGGFPGDLRVGSRVTRGQVVGRIGNTGTSRGPHAHFVVKRRAGLGDGNGHVDPYSYIESFCGVGRAQARPRQQDTPTDTPQVPSTRRRAIQR